MESMITIYKGELRTESTHLKSGSTLITDAPPDNQGKGEAFSPTDLLSVAESHPVYRIIEVIIIKKPKRFFMTFP